MFIYSIPNRHPHTLELLGTTKHHLTYKHGLHTLQKDGYQKTVKSLRCTHNNSRRTFGPCISRVGIQNHLPISHS